MKLVTLNQFETAVELLQRGMRVSIVSRITGVHPKILRSLHREIHGYKPRSGPLPSIGSILCNRTAQAASSVFATLYRSAGGDGIFSEIDLTALIASHDLYLELTEELIPPGPDATPLDITHAWIVARDIRTAVAYFGYCERCCIHYLLAQNIRIPTNCPICALKRRDISRHLRNRDDKNG